MNGAEFQRRARRYARRNGLSWRYEPRKGKGSHGAFYLGNRRTIVQYGEIDRDTLMGMFRDLGIDRRRF